MIGRLGAQRSPGWSLGWNIKSDAVVRLVLVLVAWVAEVAKVVAVIAAVGCLDILCSSGRRWDPKFISSVEA